MTRQSHMPDRGAEQNESRERVARAPLHVAVRLWGYDASLAQAWIESLPTLNGSLIWTLAITSSRPDADVLVHMVKPSRTAPGGFCWNCLGADRAIARSDSANRSALTLFAGHAHQLPPTRSGLWIACGSLPPRTALFRLAHLIAACTKPTSSGSIKLRYRMLELIGRELDVA